MNTYDITYITRPVNEALEEELLDHGVNVGSHSGVHFVMASVVTDDFHSAAEEFALELKGLGVDVERIELDLVNQSAIAARTGKSRQAVSAWVQCAAVVNGFPKPHTVVSGPLWAWSDVNEWLRRTGKECFDDACTPSPAQVDAFNAAWRSTRWPTVERVAYDSVAKVPSRSVRLAGWSR